MKNIRSLLIPKQQPKKVENLRELLSEEQKLQPEKPLI